MRLFTSHPALEVIRDKRTGKTKGYGFVSFSAPEETRRDNPLAMASNLVGRLPTDKSEDTCTQYK